MKKWISLLLCIVMMLTLLPAAIAEEPADDAEATEPAIEPEEAPEAEEPEENHDIDTPEIEVPGEDTEALTNPIEDDIEAVVNINAKNFPDANFRNWVITNIAGGKDTMTPGQADAVDKIDCSGKNIANLTGIAQFKNLKILVCNDNKLKTLDLKGNKKLEQLECKNNALTKLYVSGCPDLVKLNCTGNSISTLTLSSNKKLKELYASNNKISKLVTDNVKTLEIVYASNNALASLGNIEKNDKLRAIAVNNNKITKVDLTKLVNLQTLHIAGNKLSALDLTKNTALVNLNVKSNSLKELDLTKNVNLKTLDASANSLSKLDLTNCTDLTQIRLQDNKLTALDVTACADAVEINCENNKITTLDTSACTDLETLNLKNNGTGKLDLSANTKLKHLYLSDNLLPKLDVTALTDLLDLECRNNRIYDLDVTNNTLLENLDCANNEISTLDLSASAKLRKLNCSNNRLDELDPTACADLEELNCSKNFLRALHLSANTKLKSVNFATQNAVDPLNYTEVGGKYIFDMTAFLSASTDKDFVKPFSSAYIYNTSSGEMTMPSFVSAFSYYFDTGKGDMQVDVKRCFNADFNPSFVKGAVEYKSSTAYVLYTGDEVCPEFTVKDLDGKTIANYYYDYTYVNNVIPGTATLKVWMKGHSTEKTLTYKIYLNASEEMTIANTATGIELKWKPVEGAGGYVVYRRAWGSTTGGWTIFDRWNNTTATTFTDTAVYAGTRYQYGVKAYYTNPFDVYNLGMVGPLKTTVRITTRTLASVTPGANKITAKWNKSSVFTGYQVQVSTDANFKKDVKTVKLADWDYDKTTVTGLKADTTYYVRVRSYQLFEGMTYYGGWSNVLSAKTPK